MHGPRACTLTELALHKTRSAACYSCWRQGCLQTKRLALTAGMNTGEHAYVQRLRMDRRNQGFRPLSVSAAGDAFQVKFLGTGAAYDINLSSDQLVCSCQDFWNVGVHMKCKHICWLLVNMGGRQPSQVLTGSFDLLETVAKAQETIATQIAASEQPFQACAEACGGAECCICYEELGLPENCQRCPECSNHFHASCIVESLKHRCACPLCRSGRWAWLPSTTLIRHWEKHGAEAGAARIPEG